MSKDKAPKPPAAIRKARLLRQIERQRGELSIASHDWLQATEKVDRAWIKLLDMRKYLAVGSSVLAIYSIRHPSFLLRWAKRGFGVWSTVRLVRRTFNK